MDNCIKEAPEQLWKEFQKRECFYNPEIYDNPYFCVIEILLPDQESTSL
jgi:hypothetical protein